MSDHDMSECKAPCGTSVALFLAVNGKFCGRSDRDQLQEQHSCRGQKQWPGLETNLVTQQPDSERKPELFIVRAEQLQTAVACFVFRGCLFCTDSLWQEDRVDVITGSGIHAAFHAALSSKGIGCRGLADIICVMHCTRVCADL